MKDSTPTPGPHSSSGPRPPSDPRSSSDGKQNPSGGSSPDPDGTTGRGADMARAALEAARAQNATRRADRTGSGSTGSGGNGSGNGGSLGAGPRRLKRRRWSGPGADKARDPQRVGDTLAVWLKKTSTGREVTKATLFTRWSELVGADIAQHAQPVSLVDGELVVQAESTAWATQLRLLSPGIVKRLNTDLGHGTVTHIRTKGPTGPSWRFGNRHVPGRGPRDTYG